MKDMKIDRKLERAKRESEVSVLPFQKAETTEIGEEEGAVDLSRSGPDPDPPCGASISGAVSELVDGIVFSFSVSVSGFVLYSPNVKLFCAVMWDLNICEVN